MSKMRVYELAKELGRDNKDIINCLTANGVEVKSHMSVLEDDQVQTVRRQVPAREIVRKPAESAPAAGEAKTGEAPKKKNISRVFHSQNSRTGIQRPAGMRQQGQRPAGGRPQGQHPAAAMQGRTAAATAKPETKPAAQEVKAAQAQPETAKPVAAPETKPAAKPEGQEKTAEPVKAETSRNEENTRNERQNNRNNSGNNRNFGDRDNNRGGQGRSFGDRDNNREIGRAHV